MDNKELIKKSKPPYLLGLLCLIPLIGAFVGLGLLLHGIIRYKDKWLIIIGASGIVFTIAIYSFLFYYMKNGELSKKGFTRISQSELNELVEKIEFYKLQNGQYPDSLQQLLFTDEFTPVYDPVQTVQHTRNTMYNYKRLGEKYTLFSSGQDGIPNSSDDLYPSILIRDSTKMGLVRSN